VRGVESPDAKTFREADLTASPAPDVTGLLMAWRQGDQGALDRLLPIVYSELRNLAHGRMRAETPGLATLQTTALINETYVRLVNGAKVPWRNRTHFYALCARLMRRILVDHARARRAEKRGGDDRPLALGDWQGSVPARDEEVLALHEALERLAEADTRKAAVVELRYFGGLTVEETAEALGMSAVSVVRDWKVAKMWLRRELRSREESASALVPEPEP
jgi:RNA polymerase sigma-70 factor, ECF subfamily